MPLDQALVNEAVTPPSAPQKALRQRLGDCRHLFLRLTEPLSEEDQVVQSMPDASPTKWHLAHTTWFFEELVLKPHLPAYKVFNDHYSYCFNSYYETVGPRHPRPKRGLLTRPPLKDVLAYRNYVDEKLNELFDLHKDGLPDPIADIIEIGINHEQQHQELALTDILNVFAEEPLRPAYLPSRPQNKIPATSDLKWLPFEGGPIDIGHKGDGFAYDNEGPHHRQLVQPFEMANRLITNAEWLEFIADKGYQTPILWLSDGWNKILQRDWQAPLYWENRDGEWYQMTLRGGLTPIDPSAPVSHISYYEADAFARWSGVRLPSEFEWEHAATGLPITGNFVDSRNFIPIPASPNGDSTNPKNNGLSQMFGDLWEWTASPYTAYPGFKPQKGALGEYNGKFMCNQFVLKGGSCATSQNHIRATYRNFFYPFQRWQFSGLRLARDI